MFHKNLKTLRLKKGLSQKQVADYLNISPQSISKWEKGDALPSIEFLPNLAKCLSCEINDFFAKEDAVAIDYSLVGAFFSLEADAIYSETKTTEDIAAFVKDNPDAFDIATELCNEIKSYKTIKYKTIQGILNCSEDNAKAFLALLERHELVEKLDVDDSYFVLKDNVDGLIVLMRTQKQLCEFIWKEQADK